jgi:hypothetical protein
MGMIIRIILIPGMITPTLLGSLHQGDDYTTSLGEWTKILVWLIFETSSKIIGHGGFIRMGSPFFL